MRLSRYFLPVLKQTPAEAQIASHRLMLRAGMLRQEAAGIYAWLPLGHRVLKKVEQIVREALTELVDPYIYLEALDLMDLHRALGRKVFIVSSSAEEVVRALTEHLGDVEVIATRAKIEGGKYAGELEFYCYGENKAVAIREIAEREGIDLSGSYAYSDSITDLPMLEAVGNPVAVNPDRELRREAEKRGWQIRDFRRPVRLRQRLPQVSVPSAGTLAAVLLVAIAAVAGWVYLRRLSGARRTD